MRRRCPDTGPRWAFMKRTVIADPLDRTNIYLVRLRILETPWLACYLHSIRRPDSTRALHNHPWGFVSVLLRGGYTEAFAPDLDAAVDYASTPPVDAEKVRRSAATLLVPPFRAGQRPPHPSRGVSCHRRTGPPADLDATAGRAPPERLGLRDRAWLRRRGDLPA